jgi:uncharacterized protein
MRALLDINVLIALHDRDHIHHERVALWLDANISHGWASCPQPLAVLINMLYNSTSAQHHTFWSDEISLLDVAHFQHSHLHRHVKSPTYTCWRSPSRTGAAW